MIINIYIYIYIIVYEVRTTLNANRSVDYEWILCAILAHKNIIMWFLIEQKCAGNGE